MASYETIRQDNDSIIHALFAPLRFIRNLVIGVFIAFWVISLLFYNNLMWTVGLGGMGWIDRQERAAKFVNHVEGYPDEWADFNADFTRREPLDQWEQDHFASVPGVKIRQISDADENIADLPSFCSGHISEQDPGPQRSGWYNRTRTVFERKSSRMFEAYVTGAIATTMLRNALTEIKYGPRPKTSETIPDCEADPFKVDEVSPEEYKRWVRLSESIRMPNAPDVYIRVVSSKNSEVENVHDGHGMISGMCLREEAGCIPGSDDPDLNFYVTRYDDLFSDVAPLAPRQENAVKALNHLLDEDYWLQVAHANGVKNDKKLHQALILARVLRWNSIAVNRAPEAAQFTNFLGTDCQVF